MERYGAYLPPSICSANLDHRIQRWPGHVKARHFVLALRDYYRQHVEDKKRKAHGEEKIPRIADDDEWALEWITINRMQAIAEAFDDDASGFITIAEVNKFTSSRPKEWRSAHHFPCLVTTH